MPLHKARFWEKHANPWSAWTRIGAAPFLYVAIWFSSIPLFILVVIWYVINPFIFPKPKTHDSWASKGVLGEQLWTRKVGKDFNLFLQILTGAFFIPSLYLTWVNDFWPALYTATLAFIFKVWFVDRMRFLYELRKKDKANKKR